MASCFRYETSSATVPIHTIAKKDYADWLTLQSTQVTSWLASTMFSGNTVGEWRLIPHTNGQIAAVICIVADEHHFWSVGHLPSVLPEGVYQFDENDNRYTDYALAWGLGAYQYTRYKQPQRQPAELYLPPTLPVQTITEMVDAIYLVRDLINTPADDMGPTQFSQAAKALAAQYGASFREIVGEALLTENFPCIYTVGRASDDAPRLVDMRWGDVNHQKVTLVGKGVCFDTGGLDLKPAAYMQLMKKDMGGGANVLGLAHMIMAAKLPICLRVLIPTVENAVSGNAYRPGDVIKSRSGKTIEIGNTDAEGRVILADALTEAVSENPSLLIDMTTLTGAARVAVGTDIAALFANHDALAEEVLAAAETHCDPMWRLPLFSGYREYLNSSIADINNNAAEPYAGAITAALFLKEFVPDHIPWLHFDMMAWNTRTRPGRPQGGEAMAIRALFSYLSKRYKDG